MCQGTFFFMRSVFRHTDRTCSLELQNTKASYQFNKVCENIRCGMELNDHTLRGDVDDLGAHDAAELDQGAAVRCGVGDLDEHQLVKYTAGFFKAADFDHVKLLV